MKLRSAAAAAALNLLVFGSAASSAQAAGPEQAALGASEALTKASLDLGFWADRQTSAVLGPGPIIDEKTSRNTASALGLDRRKVE
ncbi:hypothetical protein [Streptomyces chryseus]|uniref:Uncharacterized protein n=1 Tax=Streptomyces chryseus TaxID=68186 RepID=A0ABQ3DK87_9ACTN|nr:hypothetical protein [Streptomyces chryseus]GGX14669.1 hypothetical protein GCM10010353_32550 [Streptomyces chryseus]GHA96692.1 hypothetical protein GCM10010346_19330 [Streptomyces chryseus]